MRCTAKKTLAIIVRSNNHYMVKVKGNQGRLLRAIKAHVATSEPMEYFSAHEYNRGRKEQRHVELYHPPSQIDEDWPAIKRVLFVKRSGARSTGRYNRSGYYISSLEADVQCFARGLRGHWLIENSLHYVKDVITNEDSSGIASMTAAANLSLFKSLTINLYRRQGHRSLKYASERFANKVKELLEILRT